MSESPLRFLFKIPVYFPIQNSFRFPFENPFHLIPFFTLNRSAQFHFTFLEMAYVIFYVLHRVALAIIIFTLSTLGSPSLPSPSSFQAYFAAQRQSPAHYIVIFLRSMWRNGACSICRIGKASKYLEPASGSSLRQPRSPHDFFSQIPS